MDATVIVLLAAFASTVGFAASLECWTDHACYNATSNVTIDNVTYCCSDNNREPVVKTGRGCECLSREMEDWADRTMDTGRMCLLGEKRCRSTDIGFQTGSLKYCCPNADHVEFVLYNSSSPDLVGCRCSNNTAPVLPPDAYVVPSTQEYSSSGEHCLYDALCDDFPSLTCRGEQAVYCCYNSRGIHTKTINDSMTACTCTNTFYGERCAEEPRAVPPTEQRCLQDEACPAGASPTVVKSASVQTSSSGSKKPTNVTYCCPNLLSTPHVQIVQGSTPTDVCSCSSQGQNVEGSGQERTRRWADLTNGYGRWCERGPVCEEFLTSLRFYKNDDDVLTLCCRRPLGDKIYYFDVYDHHYLDIGCRCADPSMPKPDPGAYVVPDAGRFNSTGESCSYNNGCEDFPSSKCQSSEVTFCCYGSRGMHTGTVDDRTTSCTCTNDILGEFCEGKLFPVSAMSQLEGSTHLFWLGVWMAAILGVH